MIFPSFVPIATKESSQSCDGENNFVRESMILLLMKWKEMVNRTFTYIMEVLLTPWSDLPSHRVQAITSLCHLLADAAGNRVAVHLLSRPPSHHKKQNDKFCVCVTVCRVNGVSQVSLDSQESQDSLDLKGPSDLEERRWVGALVLLYACIVRVGFSLQR